jgi:hypothetical protein
MMVRFYVKRFLDPTPNAAITGNVLQQDHINRKNQPAVSDKISALIFYFILVAFLFWPAITNLSDHIIGGIGDPMFLVWNMGWNIHSIVTLHIDGIYNANIFFPYPETLAYSDNLFFPSLVGVPIYILTNSYVTTFNIVCLLFFTLMAYSSYLLVKELTQSFTFALVGGIIYCFNAYQFHLIYHLQLIAGACWIPLSFLALIKYHNSYRAKYLAFFGLSFILLSLSSAYYMVYTAVSVFIFECFIVTTKKLFSDPKIRLKYFTHMSILILAVSVPILIVYLPYQDLKETMGFVRSVTESEFFSITLGSFSRRPTGNMLWDHVVHLKESLVHSRGEVAFIGLFPTILAVCGFVYLVISRKSRDNTYFYAIGAVGFFALLASFGPILLSIGKVTIYGPFALLRLLPGFESVRVPARFMVFVYLCIAVFSSYGLSFLNSLKKGLRLVLLPIFIIGVLAESIYYPIQIDRIPYNAGYPGVYRYINTKPKGPVAEFPVSVFDNKSPLFTPRIDPLYMYWSTSHWNPLMNGYSGFFPPLYVNRIMNGTVEEQVGVAESIGVRYLVLHKDMMDKETATRIGSLAIDAAFTKDYEDDKTVLYVNKEAPQFPQIRFNGNNLVISDLPGSPQNTYIPIVLEYTGEPALNIVPEEIELIWTLKGEREVIKKTTLKSTNPVVYRNDLVYVVARTPEKPGAYHITVLLDDDSGVSGDISINSNESAIDLCAYVMGIEYKSLSGLPNRLRTSEEVFPELALGNSGLRPLALINNRHVMVNPSYHWLDAKTREDIVFDGLRTTSKPIVLLPGKTVSIPMRVKTPNKPGKYILSVTCVWEGCFWFEQCGIPPLERSVLVE